MKYNLYLKNTRVSQLGFGAWPLGNESRGIRMSEDYGVTLVKKAIQSGINFFDTAPNYSLGLSESILGIAIKDMRDKVIINTKFGHHVDDQIDFSSSRIKESLLGSLNRLNTNYIDTLMLHNPPFEVLEGKTDHFVILDNLKKEGYIKGYGVSIDSKLELETTLKHLKVDCIELLFNIFFQETKSLFDEVKRRGIALVIKVPLDSGWLTGSYHKDMVFDGVKSRWTDVVKNRRDAYVKEIQNKTGRKTITEVALSFIWSFNAVATIIPGVRSLEQLEEHLNAVNYKINDQDKSFLESLYDEKIKPNPLPW